MFHLNNVRNPRDKLVIHNLLSIVISHYYMRPKEYREKSKKKKEKFEKRKETDIMRLITCGYRKTEAWQGFCFYFYYSTNKPVNTPAKYAERAIKKMSV
ncbi:MAG: hypothetical protein U9Q15_01565 [Patescibacteria group bacterium]|nr:hypothetical protein [Patescibacteria group bacterium]